MIIYLGVEPKRWLATEVLRFSILSRTKEPVEFKELNLFPLEIEGLGASLRRWFIPEIQQHTGRVLLLDSSCIVLGDIKALVDLDMQGKGALALPVTNPPGTGAYFTDIMLLDCDKLTDWEPKRWAKLCQGSPELIPKLLWALPESPVHSDFGPLPSTWNQMDLSPNGEVPPGTDLVHFSNPVTHPLKAPDLPINRLFLQELKKAIETEEIPLETLLLEIQQKHIHPQILEHLSI